MVSFWETARKILSGKPEESKLIVLGVFMESFAAGLWVYSPNNFAIGSLTILGVFEFIRGVAVYGDEVHAELQKKKDG